MTHEMIAKEIISKAEEFFHKGVDLESNESYIVSLILVRLKQGDYKTQPDNSNLIILDNERISFPGITVENYQDDDTFLLKLELQINSLLGLQNSGLYISMDWEFPTPNGMGIMTPNILLVGLKIISNNN